MSDPREYTVLYTDYSNPRHPVNGMFTLVAQNLKSALEKAVLKAPAGVTIRQVGEKGVRS